MSEILISRKYLLDQPDEIFVFGDNLERWGCGGAARLRNEPNTYGFITKKKPTLEDSSYYTSDEYTIVYKSEINKLTSLIETSPNKIFLISKLGAGLANKFNIFEEIIEPNIKKDLTFNNVKFLF